jgi:hypothetical protein
MSIIKIDEDVNNLLGDLVITLIDEGYFVENIKAIAYVQEIYTFIRTIPTLRQRNTTNNEKGTYYAAFKINRRTSWYILYDINTDGDFLIRHVMNNHSNEYPYFISSSREI